MVIDADLTIYYNGWVPQKNEFYKFNYKNDNLYLNTGSPNPPSPGKPRPSYEYKFIQKAIQNVQKRNIKSATELNNLVSAALKTSSKTILIAVINDQNQKRYIGVKLK